MAGPSTIACLLFVKFYPITLDSKRFPMISVTLNKRFLLKLLMCGMAVFAAGSLLAIFTGYIVVT